jgi:germination protein M
MPIVLGLLAVAFVAAVLWLGQPAPPPASQPPAPPVYPPGTERAALKLYFASPDGLSLAPEARAVLQPAATCDQMAEALRELIAGPTEEGLARVLPPETTLRQVFIAEYGTVYVNFGPEIAQQHPGGAGAELLSVYSIVSTLERNFPQVREVAILVEGREPQTLAGHVDISRPLTPRADLIAPQGPDQGPDQTPGSKPAGRKA